METNIPILNNFLYYMLCVKNCSINTVKNYSQTLQIFFDFIIEYLDWNIKPKDLTVFLLGNIEESTIIEYLIYLNHYRNNSSNTRKKALSAVRGFYKWLFMKYPYTLKNKINPTIDLPVINNVRRLPKYIKLEDAMKLQHIFNSTNSRFYIRNNTIITLFLNAGLRASELININISDIDFSNKQVRIIGKGNKERIVILNNKCMTSITKYLKTRNDTEKPLFITANSKRFTLMGIEEVCQKAYKLAGLNNCKYSAHILRHTSATYLYKSSQDIFVVKEFLGHSSIEATEIYTHIMSKTLKDAVNKNPLNNI